MEENVRPVSSVLHLIGDIFIDECTLKRSVEPLNGAPEYEANFNREITKIDEETYRVSLQGNVCTKDDHAVEIHARAVGIFSVHTSDSQKKNTLISKNTVAIMLPYVRSQIVLMTSQAGIPPVVLPIMNIADMFENVSLPGEEDASK